MATFAYPQTMEVTCERCNAEYDFDESLVGESGTTVKCTDCGHVFKIYAPRSGRSRGLLQIRFRDGHIELLSSLRELQRRARLGEITLDDEIGREGFEWRTLRDVAELRTFFQANGSASGRSLSGTVGVTPSMAGALAVAPSVRPDGAVAKHTVLGVGGPQPSAPSAWDVSPDAQTIPRGATPALSDRPTPPAPSPSAGPSNPAAHPTPAPRMPSPPAPSAAAPQAFVPHPPQAFVPDQGPKSPPSAAGLFLADDDATDPRPSGRAGGGGLRWAVLAVLLAGGVWVAVNALNSRDTSEDTVAAASPESPEVAAAAEGPTLEELQKASTPKEPDASTAQQAEEKAGEKTAARGPEEDQDAPEPTHARASNEESSKRERASRRGRRGSKRPHARREPDRQDYGALVNHGDRLFRDGKLQEAQATFERAIALRGSGSEANSGMGFVLLAQGQAQKSLPYFSRATRNGFAAAYIGQGDALAKLGRKQAAVEAYKSYLARLPSGGRAKYARARLEALGKASAQRPAASESAPTPSAPQAAPAGQAPPTPEEPQPDEGDDYVPAGAMTEESP